MGNRKWYLAVLIGTAAFAALSACGGMSGEDDMPQKGYRTNAFGESHGPAGDGGIGTHQNKTLTRSEEMASTLEMMNGISRAEVVFGSSNAYVGLVLDERALTNSALGGSSARSSSSPEEYGIRGNYYGTTDSRVLPAPGRGALNLEETGTSDGARRMYGLGDSDGGGIGKSGRSETFGRGGIVGGIGGVATHRSGNPSANPYTGSVRMGAKGSTGASSITDAGGAAGGAAAGENGAGPGAAARKEAFIANNGLSQQVRARVEAVIRSLEPQIRRVYVSTDPEVVERLAQTGAAGGGDVESFNAWAAEVFGSKDDKNLYDMQYRGSGRR